MMLHILACIATFLILNMLPVSAAVKNVDMKSWTRHWMGVNPLASTSSGHPQFFTTYMWTQQNFLPPHHHYICQMNGVKLVDILFSLHVCHILSIHPSVSLCALSI